MGDVGSTMVVHATTGGDAGLVTFVGEVEPWVVGIGVN